MLPWTGRLQNSFCNNPQGDHQDKGRTMRKQVLIDRSNTTEAAKSDDVQQSGSRAVMRYVRRWERLARIERGEAGRPAFDERGDALGEIGVIE